MPRLSLSLSLSQQRGGGGASALHLVVIGDSMTANVAAGNYPDALAALITSRQGVTVSLTRAAYSGSSWDYTQGVGPTVNQLITSTAVPAVTPSAKIIVLAGTNGLKLGGHTAAAEYASFETGLASLISAGATPSNIVVLTMLPRESFSETIRGDYNALLVGGAVTHGYTVCSLHLNTDLGLDGCQGDTTYFSDTIHPTAAGYDQIARLCYDKLYTDYYAAFTASQLPGYYDHWDAQLFASITQSGSRVSSWASAASSGRNLDQGTSGNQPLYNASGLNGHPTIEFDGGSRRAFLAKASGIVFNAKSMTFWSVAQFSEVVAENVVWYLGLDNTTWDDGMIFWAENTTMRLGDAVNGGNCAYSSGADTNSRLWTGHANGASPKMFRDGINSGVGGFNNANPVNATALRVGSPALDFYRMDGYIGEIGFCSGQLTAYYRQLWEKKLAAKWGTPAPAVP